MDIPGSIRNLFGRRSGDDLEAGGGGAARDGDADTGVGERDPGAGAAASDRAKAVDAIVRDGKLYDASGHLLYDPESDGQSPTWNRYPPRDGEHVGADILTKCERCGAAVALSAADHENALRQNAEIVCPDCFQNAETRDASGDRAEVAADDSVVDVVVDAEPSPLTELAAAVVVNELLDGDSDDRDDRRADGGGQFGGAGASASWDTDQ
jgi:DNA-directed RNA polymerase subunit RPC12/RpoP